MPKSPEEYAHLEWLGYVQPVGLVVSIPAMLEAQCYVNKNIMGEHARFLSCLPRDKADEVVPEIRDLPELAQKVLGWEKSDLITIPQRVPMPAEHSCLEVVLPQYHETLRPTHVVPEFQPTNNEPSSTSNKELASSNYLMLIQALATGTDLDEAGEADSSRHWNAAPQAKFERLLRETEVPIGLLSNGRQLRLVYSPRGETSGHATFNVDEMIQVAGRPMFAALHMLLCNDRLFSLGDKQRLPAILENSRKYQNTVSTALAEQVLAALYELMRGFQAANDVRKGDLLRDVLANDPNHVYAGLLRVLMRLVFVMYAEDRDLLSSDPVYSNHYSVTGLFNRLREDAGRFPDTMNQRFGAWSQLITLFRLIYEGGQHNEFKLPPRKGYLFDPDRYPFLEGRVVASSQLSVVRRIDEESEEQATSDTSLTTNNQQLSTTIPRVSDGIVFNVLQNLLILDGERLSYRTLDVEQIGSVYETVMGFNLEVAAGKSIAIKPVKSHGAPATINLDTLLVTPGKDRAKWLKEESDQKITGAALKELKDAGTIDELLTALDKKVAKKITERVVPAGAIVLQPSDERRRSGSHYTPRSLTEPIVRTTLEPILKQLLLVGDEWLEEEQRLGNELEQIKAKLSAAKRDNPKLRTKHKQLTAELRQVQKQIELARAAAEKQTPHPAQILQLKICDPAMGSGAFLVETCRQLGDELIKAWYAHSTGVNSDAGLVISDDKPSDPAQTNHQSLTTNNYPPDIPPDEDEVLYARRLVAQRCLYGVDKNVMAVDLAKLSLWLVTLAKDHAFTFLDHALRHGDSLVGLTREQIIGFHWEVKKQQKFGEDLIQRRLDRATEARAKILGAREDSPYRDQQQRMANADEALDLIRLVGDACVSGFFSAQKKKDREADVEGVYGFASSYLVSISGGVASRQKLVASGQNEKQLATNNQSLATGGIDFASRNALQAAADRLLEPPHPIPAFHWEIEFPEVFARENGGFDAFVGNPPFLGGMKISVAFGVPYIEWLLTMNEGTHGNGDLVSHFFRRTFDICRTGGTLGLIATNSIAQGDTRNNGLGWICQHEGTIYNASKRIRWPGMAAVVVSAVHIIRGTNPIVHHLDGKVVEKITAFLLTAGSNEDPARLNVNKPLGRLGVKVLGVGFLFDDQAGATPISVMEDLVRDHTNLRTCIFPFIGGKEINTDPQHAFERYVIDFGDRELDEVRSGWPQLLEIVERLVRPQREAQKNKGWAKKWWQFAGSSDEVRSFIGDRKRILANSQVSTRHGITFLPSDWVYSHGVNIFAIDTFSGFAMLQSRCHEMWARIFGSSMKDDLRYSTSDCLETFPFPPNWESDEQLEETGTSYFQFRQAQMLANDEGLTQTYNRFHDPHEQSEGILELRRLHGLMDGAVLRAYGWDDLAESARCEFLLDYDEEEDDADAVPPAAGARKKSRKKKPWRLRWPDEFRDEVLARLLELNEQRHKEELLAAKSESGKRASSASSKKKTSKPKRVAARKQQESLFSTEDLETELGK